MASYFKEKLNATATAAKAGNLDAAKAHWKDVIKKAWEREITEIGMALPAPYADVRVNFGIDDVLIWESGIALTEDDPVAVRTIDNRMTQIPRAVAETVPTLQRAHYALILQKKWQLQQAIDDAETVDDVFKVRW